MFHFACRPFGTLETEQLEVQILTEPIGEAAILMLGEQDKVPFSLQRGLVFLGLDRMRVLLQDRDPGFPLQLGEEELQSFPAFQVPVPHIREFHENWPKFLQFFFEISAIKFFCILFF